MAKEKTTKERVICIEKQQIKTDLKVDTLITGQSNHLEHHKRLYDKVFRIFLVALSPVVALIVWALVLVYKSR